MQGKEGESFLRENRDHPLYQMDLMVEAKTIAWSGAAVVLQELSEETPAEASSDMGCPQCSAEPP